MSRKIYRSAAAKRLASKAGVVDPAVAAKLLASRVISDLPGPPFDLDSEHVRSALGILDIRTVVDSSLDGRIVPTESGFVVELSRRLNAERRAFTLAHELAHTFFLDSDSNTERLADGLSGGTLDVHEEELLCDIAAAEMLMPAAALIRDHGLCAPDELRHSENAFFAAVLEREVSVYSVLYLARMFRTSLSATARRITELGLWSSHIGFWSVRDGKYPKFAFGFSVNRDPWIPSGTIANNNVIAQAVDSSEAVEGCDDIGFQTQGMESWGDVIVQALRLPTCHQVISVTVFGRDAVRKQHQGGRGISGRRSVGQRRLFE